MNNPKLCLAMAKLLPELLEIVKVHAVAIGMNQNDSYTVVRWIKEVRALHESEWLYVMRLVEQTLSEAQKIQYADILMHMTNASIYDAGYYPGEGEIDLSELAKLVFLGFNQRATAAATVLNISI